MKRMLNQIKKWIKTFNEKRHSKWVLKQLKTFFIISIVDTGFNIKKILDENEKVFIWNEIEDMRFSVEKDEIFLLKNNRVIDEVLVNYIGWNGFLKSIPKGYKSFDYEYRENYFLGLIGCEVCGLIAVKNDKCLSCNSDKWSTFLSEIFNSKDSYIREEQLDMFEVEDMEKIDINNRAKEGFESDLEWKCLVTEADIRKRYLDLKQDIE